MPRRPSQLSTVANTGTQRLQPQVACGSVSGIRSGRLNIAPYSLLPLAVANQPINAVANSEYWKSRTSDWSRRSPHISAAVITISAVMIMIPVVIVIIG
jgi:hypothetical protein